MTPDQESHVLHILAAAARLTNDGQSAAAAEQLERLVSEVGDTWSPAVVRRITLCLADVYRDDGRYADELALLHRYVAKHPDDDQRTRLLARLTKVDAIVAAQRTSSVVPVNISRLPRRRSASEQRSSDRQKRARTPERTRLGEAAVVLRTRAAGLITRASAALSQARQRTFQQAPLLQQLTENRQQLRDLMTEYGTLLAQRGVARDDAIRFVRDALAAGSEIRDDERQLIAHDAEVCALDAYDAAAA
jgi:hypothetical protein